VGLSVELKDVAVKYGDFLALKNINLHVEAGEGLVLLGPSGSGKSTLLRAVAGLTPVASGRVYIGGNDVTYLPPDRRKISMLFQDLALFPHLNVFENVAFGLRLRHLPDEEVRKRVVWALELVRLDPAQFMSRGCTSSPAASNRGLPSPGRWWWSRRSSSSTSPLAT